MASTDPRIEESDPLIGVVLGGLYAIRHKIGEGGMGTVYEAEHIHLEKAYAIKVLKPGDNASRPRLQRFVAEAKAASRIEHPNIVDVFNFDGDEQGRVFIVMERLKGQSLAVELDAGPIDLERALQITDQVCSALQATHDQGVVHRDLKPDNVFVCEGQGRPQIKILDFGISMLKQPTEQDIKLTGTDELLGTPLYMSPEQARGERDIDHRVDVYAIAVILYEMLTGTPPFYGDNQFQVLWKHGSEEPQMPSLRNTDVHIPAHIERAIIKGMSKDKADRFSTMHEFRDAIFSAPDSAHAARLSAATKAWVPIAALLSIAVGAWWFTQPKAIDQPVVVSKADPPAQTVKENPVPPSIEQVLISVNSRPSGAKVYIDGRLAEGVTPLKIELPKGSQAKLRLTRPGYVAKVHSIDAQQNSTLKLRLKRQSKSEPTEIKLDF